MHTKLASPGSKSGGYGRSDLLLLAFHLIHRSLQKPHVNLHGASRVSVLTVVASNPSTRHAFRRSSLFWQKCRARCILVSINSLPKFWDPSAKDDNSL